MVRCYWKQLNISRATAVRQYADHSRADSRHRGRGELPNQPYLRSLVSSLSQMARTQKNKATARHLGVLKAKLAKLRRELITPKGGGSGPGEGFDVAKTGDARIGFVGESNHR